MVRGGVERHVTTLIDALEEIALVERSRHPTDRRATIISLTADGMAEAERFVASREEWANLLLGNVPAARLTSFIAVVDQFVSTVEELTDAGMAAAPLVQRRDSRSPTVTEPGQTQHGGTQ